MAAAWACYLASRQLPSSMPDAEWCLAVPMLSPPQNGTLPHYPPLPALPRPAQWSNSNLSAAFAPGAAATAATLPACASAWLCRECLQPGSCRPQGRQPWNRRVGASVLSRPRRGPRAEGSFSMCCRWQRDPHHPRGVAGSNSPQLPVDTGPLLDPAARCCFCCIVSFFARRGSVG